MSTQRIISKTITKIIKPRTWRVLYTSHCAFLPILSFDSHSNSTSSERQVHSLCFGHSLFHRFAHTMSLKSLHFIFFLINLLNHQFTCNLQKSSDLFFCLGNIAEISIFLPLGKKSQYRKRIAVGVKKTDF